MPVPKFRTSASKRNMRRSHHALKAPGFSICPNCGETKRPHTVCHSCGHYGGQQVMQTKAVSREWNGDEAKNFTQGS